MYDSFCSREVEGWSDGGNVSEVEADAGFK